MFGGDALERLAIEGYLAVALPKQLREQALMLARSFYDFPVSERMKLAAARGDDFLGYVPSESEVDEYRLETPFFSGARRRGYASYDLIGDPRAFAASGLRCSNKWPDDRLFVRDARRVCRSMRKIAQSAAEEIFDLASQRFGTTIKRSALDGRTCSMLRLLLYERSSHEETSKAHTDYEFLAILVSNEPGLQVQQSNGTWRDVPVQDMDGVVLPGDMLALATGGNIRAARHRVRFGSMRRLSVICFQGLRYKTPIQYPGKRAEVLFGEHICGMKIRGTPHLERAWEDGRLKLSFDIPYKNPLSPDGAADPSA